MFDSSVREARPEDRAMIAAVLYRYARLAKEGFPPEDLDQLFAPGARFRLPDGTEVDARENMLRFARGGEFWVRTIGHVTTIDISFVGDDEAHVESFLIATSEKAPLDHWCTWRDVFRRQPDGSWRLAHREIPAEDFGASPESVMNSFPTNDG